MARRGFWFLAVVLAALLITSAPGSAEGAYRIAIAGEYPSGYNGLLAREGIPREILLDYQLLDPEVLRRFDLILVAQLGSVAPAAIEPLMAYARDGGTLVLEGTAFPPETLVSGTRGRVKNPPGIVVAGAGNPLAAILGDGTEIAAAAYTHYLTLESENGIQVLARYQAKIAGDGTHTSVPGTGGTPAIWSRPVGKGLLVYSGPGIGFSLALQGPEHEALADALIRHLSGGRVEPQLVPEGQRFGRKQSAASEGLTDGGPRLDEDPPAEAPEAASPAPADLPAGVQPIEGSEDGGALSLRGTYLPARGRSELLLDYRSSQSFVRALFEHRRVTLTRVADGETVERATLSLGNGKEIPFQVRLRDDGVILAAGEHRASVAAASNPGAGRAGTRGKGFAELSLQPIEAISFSDDFMRTPSEASPWTAVSGNWSIGWCSNPGLTSNPFSYSASATGPGLSTAGYWFWNDYEVAASVKASGWAGAAGLAFYYQDPKNTLLFRAQVREKPEKVPGGLALVRVRDGKEKILARRDGCLVRGQWYRLGAQVKGESVTALLDGVPVLRAEDAGFLGGQIALYVSDSSALFDDVRAQPVQTGRLLQAAVDNGTARFAGSIDVDSWAAPATQWDPDPETRGLFWRRGRFFGDLRADFRLSGVPAGAGQRKRLTLLLTRDGGTPEEGYALIAEQGGEIADQTAGPNEHPWRLEIRRRDVVVARWQGPAGAEPVVGLQRLGSRLVGSVDGQAVMEYADREPLVRQWRLGLQAEGFRPRLSGLRVQGDRILDYTFDQAPTDWWVTSGTWELCNRWSCTPEWSWFGGTSTGTAAVWNKWRLCGDVTLDYYVGPRMVDRGPDRPKEVCHDFNAVLCGDGHDVSRGYSFVIGQGDEGAVAKLLRNGQVVATNDAFRWYTAAHNRWFNVRIEKRDATLTLRIEEQPILSWTDPDPLQEGYAGIWTRDNGILLPRVTIYTRGVTGEVLSLQ